VTDFYAIEATINRPFTDPVGPADSGWAVMPIGALCELEAQPSSSTMIFASDQGYRTRDTDPSGVVIYPASVVDAFNVNVGVNLDPTQSAVAAAWGTLELANLEHLYDATVAAWNTDGQAIRILRGTKTREDFAGVASGRTTQGSYFDGTRTMQIAPPRTLRQDWTTGSPIVLNEPASTNILPHSMDFLSPWGNSNLVLSNDGTLAPDGITPAVLASDTATVTVAHYLNIQGIGVANVQNTFSVFAKYSSHQWLNLVLFEQAATGNAVQATFDLVNGTVTQTFRGGSSGLTLSSSIVALPNGWYRCSLTCTPGVSGGFIITRLAMVTGPTGGVNSYTGTGTGYYLWGAQLETGTLTSYIATTTAAVARAADLNYPARNIFVDPPYASLVQIFAGVMGPWLLKETTVEIALRDPSYYLERPVPRNLYGGTGLLDGDTGLVGLQKPIAIGEKAVASLSNISPVLIDASALIYQVHDGACFIFAVYDGGYAGNVFQADVANLYVGTTTAGHYRTCVAKGLFQLGSTPVFQVTADISENWSLGALVSQLAYRMLITNMGVPSTLVSSADGQTLDARGADPVFLALAMAMEVALYIASSDSPTGVSLLSRLLEPTGAQLVPCRDGKLRAFVPCAIPGGTLPVFTFDATTIVSINVDVLPSSVDPPPWRVRIACDRNWTVMTSGLAGAVPAARLTWLAAPFRVGVAQASPTALTQMAKPNDQPVLAQDSGAFGTASSAAVAAIASGMLALWGMRRKIYLIEVPATVGETLDWGSVVEVISDFDGLQAGKLGQVVGWSYHSTDATATFRVLV
jgi:hypothetical protein